jgi:ketosteroid isomerase-like protein
VRRARFILSLAAVTLAIAGCGGGSQSKPESTQIRAAVTSYFRAFAAGDGKTVCSHLAKDSLAQLAKASHGRSCPDEIVFATQQPGVKRHLAGLGKATVSTIKVNGNTATAQVHAVGRSTTVPLKKEDGAWKIYGALTS